MLSEFGRRSLKYNHLRHKAELHVPLVKQLNLAVRVPSIQETTDGPSLALKLKLEELVDIKEAYDYAKPVKNFVNKGRVAFAFRHGPGGDPIKLQTDILKSEVKISYIDVMHVTRCSECAVIIQVLLFVFPIQNTYLARMEKPPCQNDT
jgi:hypothetical protein